MSLVGGRECQAVAVAVRRSGAVYSRLPASSESFFFSLSLRADHTHFNIILLYSRVFSK